MVCYGLQTATMVSEWAASYMRRRKSDEKVQEVGGSLAALCMMGTAGCASQTSDVPSEQPGSESLTEPVSRETQEIIPESSREEAPSGSRPGGKETQPESTEGTRRHCPTTRILSFSKRLLWQRISIIWRRSWRETGARLYVFR